MLRKMIAPTGNGAGGRGGFGAGDADLVAAADSVADGDEGERVAEEDELIDRVERAEEEDDRDTLAVAVTDSLALLDSNVSSMTIAGLQQVISCDFLSH